MHTRLGRKSPPGLISNVSLKVQIRGFNSISFHPTDAELIDEDEQPSSDSLDGAVQSVAEAYPAGSDEQHDEEEQTFIATHPVANDVPEDVPEAPVHVVPTNNKKTPVVQHDEEDEEDEDVPVRSRNRGTPGSTYFPVTFGSTNGGAIAIANSYSTGKGEKNLNSLESTKFERNFFPNSRRLSFQQSDRVRITSKAQATRRATLNLFTPRTVFWER